MNALTIGGNLDGVGYDLRAECEAVARHIDIAQWPVYVDSVWLDPQDIFIGQWRGSVGIHAGSQSAFTLVMALGRLRPSLRLELAMLVADVEERWFGPPPVEVRIAANTTAAVAKLHDFARVVADVVKRRAE